MFAHPCRPSSAACPWCRASIGRPCTMPAGSPIQWHGQRHSAAIRAYLREAAERAREYRAERLARWRDEAVGA